MEGEEKLLPGPWSLRVPKALRALLGQECPILTVVGGGRRGWSERQGRKARL